MIERRLFKVDIAKAYVSFHVESVDIVTATREVADLIREKFPTERITKFEIYEVEPIWESD